MSFDQQVAAEAVGDPLDLLVRLRHGFGGKELGAVLDRKARPLRVPYAGDRLDRPRALRMQEPLHLGHVDKRTDELGIHSTTLSDPDQLALVVDERAPRI